jgi:hypothetical protein
MPDDKANLSVSWKTVAIGAVVIALTALVLCAIVTTIDKADTLSVVALGLAVVAFIIQIIVFIVQAAAAAQQDLKTQEIYGSTLRVLATIEEKAEGTQRTVSNMSDRMLAALLEKAIPEAANAGVPIASPEFSSKVAERVGELARAQQSEPGHSSGTNSDSHGFLSKRDDMYTFPDIKDVQRIVPLLTDLSELEAASLSALGEDLAKSPVTGLSGLNDAKALYDRGFVRKIAGPNRKPIFVLTPNGIIAARVLLSNTVPEDALPEVIKARETRERQQERLKAYRQRLESDIPLESI